MLATAETTAAKERKLEEERRKQVATAKERPGEASSVPS
jgi:hypothetical protein